MNRSRSKFHNVHVNINFNFHMKIKNLLNTKYNIIFVLITNQFPLLYIRIRILLEESMIAVVCNHCMELHGSLNQFRLSKTPFEFSFIFHDFFTRHEKTFDSRHSRFAKVKKLIYSQINIMSNFYDYGVNNKFETRKRHCQPLSAIYSIHMKLSGTKTVLKCLPE